MADTRFFGLRRWAGRSLLVGLAGCNAGLGVALLRADAPATRPSAAPATAPVVDVRKTVEYLASDELEGRASGSPGIDKAADHIAGLFATMGLQRPPGWDSYFQPFQITTATTVDPKTTLSAGDGRDWGKGFDGGPKLTRDFQPLSFSSQGAFDAPVVFAGYGVVAKHHGYDDYDGLDVKGKVVLVMRFEPMDADGVSAFTGKKDDWSDNAAIPAKAKLAAERGAVALILVNPPNHQKDDAITPFARNAQFDRATIPVIQVKRPVADALLAGVGVPSPATRPAAATTRPATAPAAAAHGHAAANPHAAADPHAADPHAAAHAHAGPKLTTATRPTAGAMVGGPLAQFQAAIDAAGAPRSVAVDGVRAKADVVFKRTEKSVRNVAAVLPGWGPLASEFVVVGAHYDHLGRGGSGSLAPFSKDVHHGADDNASGTAAMLKIAEQMSTLGGSSSVRSVLFVAFTGEELGLLGSNHFVAHSPVPLERVAGMLNLDMVGRIRDNSLQVGGSGTAPSFERILKAAADGTGLKLSLNSKGGLGPSDHTAFATKRVPVLFFFSGLHPDYHRPSDTADKINYDGIGQAVTLGKRVVLGIATMPKEAYVADFDRTGMLGMSGSGSASGGARASLGIVPDYSDDTVQGVRISGTSPGSAAERAGLKGGDVIVGWAGSPLNNLTDMMGVLMKSKPGDKVKLKVLRDGKPVELEATLTERKG